MRFVQSICIGNFDLHLDQAIVGQQQAFTPFGHSLDAVVREMTVSLWYNGATKPTNPDPNGWIQFQLVQPIMETDVVRAYPDGYTILAESERIPFLDIIEHKAIRVRGQGGTFRYMEPIYVVSLGFKSSMSFDAAWKGLENAAVSLNYHEEQSDGTVGAVRPA